MTLRTVELQAVKNVLISMTASLDHSESQGQLTIV